MLTTKRVVTRPEAESGIIDMFQLFGWKLTNRNEIYNSNEVFDGAYSWTYGNATSGTIVTHQETTHFVTLLFQIDDADPSYNTELMNLFARYASDCDTLNREAAKAEKAASELNGIGGFKGGIIGGGALFLLSLLMAILGGATQEYGLMGGGIAMAICGIITVIVFLMVGLQYRQRHVNDAQMKENHYRATVKNVTSDIEDIVRRAKEIQRTAEKNGAAPRELASQAKPAEIQAASPESSTIAQLREYKKLLDEGIITQEEFDAKKKELL